MGKVIKLQQQQVANKYIQDQSDWNSVASSIDKVNLGVDAPPVSVDKKPVKSSEQNKDNWFTHTVKSVANTIVPLAGTIIDIAKIKEPKDYLSGSYKTFMNNSDNGSISTWSAWAKDAGTSNLAIDQFVQHLHDPGMKEYLAYTNAWRNDPDRFNRNSDSELTQTDKTSYISKYKPGSFIFEPIERASKSKDYDDTLLQPVYNWFENLGSRNTPDDLPGVLDVPDNLKDAATKYSGLVKEYLKARDQYGSGSVFGDIKNSLVKGGVEGLNNTGIISALTDAYIRKQARDNGKVKPMPTLDDIYNNIDKIDLSKDESIRQAKENIKYKFDWLDQKRSRAEMNIIDRGDASDYYKKKVEEGKWLYELPGLAGSSASEIKSQVLGQITNMTIGSLATAAAEAAIPGSGTAKAIKIASVALGTATQMAFSRYGREQETNQDVDQNSDLKFSNSLKANGSKPLEDRNDSELLSSLSGDPSNSEIKTRALNDIKKFGKISDNTKKRLILGLKTSIYGTSDSKISKAILDYNVGLEEYRKQDNSLFLLDAAEAAIDVMPFTKLSKLAGKLDDVIEAGAPVERGISKVAKGIKDYYEKSFLNNTLTGAIIRKTGQVAGTRAVSAGLEGYEEALQAMTGHRYVQDQLRNKNTSSISALVDAHGAGIAGIESMLGINTDDRHIEDAQIYQNARGGAILGFFMGLPMSGVSAVRDINSYRSDAKAKEFVDAKILDGIESKNTVDFGKRFADAEAKGRSESILSYMEKLRSNPPEGITREQIDERINAAHEAIRAANNPGVVDYIKKNSSYGSEAHKTLTGLIVDYNRTLNNAKDIVNTNNAEFNRVLSSEHENNQVFNSYLDSLVKDNNELSVPIDKKALFDVKSKLDTVNKLIEFKNGLDESTIGSDVNSNKNTLFKQSLNTKKSQLENQLNSIGEQFGLTKDEIENIPETALSKDAEGFLSKSIAAESGMSYDSYMVHSLLGQKISLDKNGKVLVSKMSDKEHADFVNRQITSYNNTRQANIDEQNRKDVEDIAQEQEEQITNDTLIKAQTVHGTLTEDDSTPKKIVETQQPNLKQNYSDEATLPIDDLSSSNERTNEIKDQISTPTVSEEGTVDDLNRPQIGNASEVKKQEVSESADLSPLQSENMYLEGSIINPSAISVSVDKNGNMVEDAIDISGLTRNALAIIEQAEAEEKELSSSVISTDGDTEIRQIVDEELANRDIAQKNNLVEEALEAKTTSQLSDLGQILPGSNPEEQLDKKYDKLSHTLFWFPDRKVDGFEHGKALQELSRKQNAFDGASIEIVVSSRYSKHTSIPGQKKMESLFKIEDRNTWDYATIEVQITKDGKKYIAFIKSPDAALSEKKTLSDGVTSVPRYDESLVYNNLVPFRNSIIELEAERAKVGGIITTDPITVSNWTWQENRRIEKDSNGNTLYRAVNRPLYEIPGFGIKQIGGKPDFSSINKNTLRLEYGKGESGDNSTIGADGLPSKSLTETNTGNIFWVTTDYKSGDEVRVKLNKNGFSDDDGVAEFIYDLAFSKRANTVDNYKIDISPKKDGSNIVDTGMKPSELLSLLVPFGEHTKRDAGDLLDFRKKQFYINERNVIVFGVKPKLDENGNHIVGPKGHHEYTDNMINLNLPTVSDTDRLTAIKYIKENYVRAIGKSHMWNDDGNDNLVKDIVPELNRLLSNPESKLSKIEFAKGFSISKEDMDLTWTAFLVKTDALKSDKGDQIYNNPFLYIGSPKLVSSSKDTAHTAIGQNQVDISSNDKSVNAVNESKQILEEEKIQKLKEHYATVTQEKINDGSAMKEAAEINSLYDNKIFELEKKERAIQSNETRTLGERSNRRGRALSVYNESYKNKINIDKEVSWIKDKLGLSDDDIEITSKIITIAGNIRAMGVMRNDSIVLWSDSEEGTGYHEAYHRVSLLLFSRAERLRAYEAAKKEYPELRGLQNNEIEEVLANKFKEYKLAQGDIVAPSVIKQFFRKIYNFIQKLFRLNNRDIKRIFDNIESGIYNKYSINQNSLNEFNANYSGVAAYGFKDKKFNNIVTKTQYDNIIDSLTYELFSSNNVETINDIQNISFETLKKIIQNTIDSNKFPERNELYSELLDRFDSDIAPDIKKNLSYMQIREIDEDNVTDESSNQIVEEDSILKEEIESHTKASYETSKKDNILAAVKMFISTIPHTEFDGTDIVYVTDPSTGFNKFTPFDISWNTMISVLSDCSSPSSMIDAIRLQAKVSPFFDELLYKLSNVTDDNFITQFWNSMYSMRHNFINVAYNKSVEEGFSSFSVRDSNIDRESRVLPLAWGATFAGNESVYKTDSNGNVSFDPSVINNAISRYNYLVNNVAKPYGRSEKIGDVVINGTKISSLTKESDMSIVINELVGILNSVGIMIDANTISHIITSKLPGDQSFQTPQRKLCNLIAQQSNENKLHILFQSVLPGIIENKGKLIKRQRKESVEFPIQAVFAKEKFARVLAEAHSASHVSMQEIMVTGADGAKLYPISQNNTLSDTVRMLNQDMEHRANLEHVSYVSGSILDDGTITGSIVLNQLKKNPNKKLQTKSFVKLYEEETGDKGRDYFDITPMEDYISKMTMLKNDILVSPTMADKKSYDGISGIELFHNPIVYERVDTIVSGATRSSARITFDKSVTSQFTNYADAEFEAIKKAFEFYKDSRNKEYLIDVYHVGGKNSDTGKKWAGNHGNGLRFRHFDKWKNIQKVNNKYVVTFINFNELIDDRVNKFGPIEGMSMAIRDLSALYFERPRDEKELTTNYTLANGLKDELDYAKHLGLIDFNKYESGDIDFSSIRNVNLDKGEFEKQKAEYSRSNNSVSREGILFNNYGEQGAVLNIISDMYVNGCASVIEFEKLISKDPAFYKDADAKIKRLSSIMSTGGNLRTEFPEGHEFHGVTKFNVSEVLDNNIASPDYNKIRNIFISGEINDLIVEAGGERISDLNQLIENEQLPESSRNEDMHLRYIDLKSKYPEQFKNGTFIGENNSRGYNNVNETDATVYIRPSMFRSIKMRLGEWSTELQEAYNIMEDPSSSWETNPELYSKASRLIMQPLKTIYFGSTFTDGSVGLEIPKLDKMAMFTLFKAVSTGDLAKVRERMDAEIDSEGRPVSPIDMIAFDSAVKVGNDKAINIYTDNTNNEISDLGKMKVFKQDFKSLRKQLVTDPHHAAEITVATQPIKACMSNIDESKIYSNITNSDGSRGMSGSDLIKTWSDAINELSDRGVLDVERSLGIKMNDSGVYEIDSNRLFSMLAEDANNSKMPSDVIDMLNSYGLDNKVPLQALMDNKWVESRILSNIAKNTIDIQTPGGMFIQMSAFGLKSIDASNFNSGKITQEEFNAKHGNTNLINNGEKLRFINEDGSMDAVISINLFKDVIPYSLRNSSFDEQKQYLIDNKLIGKDADPAGIGYRVPTQGLSSISALKIVDVVPSTVGDTIILPSEFTKLTGSDFDIDKLYFSRYNYKNGKKLEFDYSLSNENGDSPWKLNSKEAVQNRLLDVFMATMTDPERMHETRQPLDTVTDYLKDNVLKDIESLKSVDKKIGVLNYASPAFQSRKKDEYSSSKRGIAPFALNNAHHALTQMAKLKLLPIKILEDLEMRNLYGIKGRDGLKILDWLSAMINAHVDAGKDPYIVRLNVNSYTYNITNLLLRTGVGENTFYFLSQESLINLSNEVNKSGGRYGQDQSLSKAAKERNAINKVLAMYLSGMSEMAKTPTQKTIFEDAKKGKFVYDKALDKDFLRNQLKQQSEKKTFSWYYNQAMILDTFVKLKPFSEQLSELVRSSQIDNKKAGSTFNLQRLFSLRVDRIKSSANMFENIDDFFSNTFIDRKMNNSTGLAKRISEGMFYRTTAPIERLSDKITALTGKSNIDSPDIVAKISSTLDSHIKSEFYDKLLNERGVDLKGMFFGKDSMASRLWRIIDKINSGEYIHLESNMLINSLKLNFASIASNPVFQSPNFIENKNTNTSDPKLIEGIKEYWGELLDDPNDEISNWAKDFILYQFYTTGENSSMHMVKLGEDVRKDLGYYDFTANKLQEISSTYSGVPNVESTVRDIFRNKWYDDDFVPVVTPYQIKITQYGPEMSNFVGIPSPIDYKGSGFDSIFINEKPGRPVGYSSDGYNIYTPYVKVKTSNDKITNYVLYRLIGSVYKGNKELPVYSAVSKLGTRESGKYIFEFNREKSIIDGNNLLMEGPENITPDSIYNQVIEYNKNHKGAPIGNSRYQTMLEAFSTFVRIPDLGLDDNANKYNFGFSSIDENDVNNFETINLEPTKQSENTFYNSMKEITNHSGGALGADSMFDKIGREYGVEKHIHYYHGNRTPLGNRELTNSELEEGWSEVLKANELLHRRPEAYKDLLSRNWFQVKNSTQIIAIAPIASNMKTVEGGTGWAVAMGQTNDKKIFVFNLKDNLWYKWNGSTFEPSEIPVLDKNFAGIGSRQDKGVMTSESIQAIRDVYKNTEDQLENVFSIDKSKSTDDIWNEYSSTILNKHPNATIEDLNEIVREIGKQGLEDYINKCF